MNALTQLPTPGSPWHAGELRLQRSAGVAGRMDEVGHRNIRDHLIEQHRRFYPQLPFVVLGTVDPAGDVWATLRARHPGFLGSPDPFLLRVGVGRDEADPADAGIREDAAIALLGIELRTRRRNRLNGTIVRSDESGFSIHVEQSYGNCPQYIQERTFAFARDPDDRSPVAPTRLAGLDTSVANLVRKADTCFVASYIDGEDGHRRIDVSHRGGRTGFVRLDADDTLTIPDFAGNLFFNTLGNFLVNPKAGLVFVDFDTGDLLQMTGDAEVILDSPEIAAFQGAERLWRFRPRQIIWRPQALPLRWTFEGGWSPNSLLTGDWEEAGARLRAAERGNAWRPFRIARIVEESTVVRSLHLEPTDGSGITPHQAGQFLPIRVNIPGAPEPVQRTYTISVAPSDQTYRISVKREGLVSTQLHALREGDVIEARAPAGTFTIDAAERRPVVFLAAGIGITPVLAMLRRLVDEGRRTRRTRPTWILYGARALKERAFDSELADLVRSAGGAVRLVRFLSDAEATDPGSYDRVGRIAAPVLTSILPFNDYDFYLCGPSGFMQSLYDGLRDLNVSDDRIHAEAFGPAGLIRRREMPPIRTELSAPATEAVPVRFSKSGVATTWTPGSGSLLELAEAAGLRPEFGCRSGSCGTCRANISEGAVAYAELPSADVGPDEALICCAVPAATARNGIILGL